MRLHISGRRPDGLRALAFRKRAGGAGATVRHGGSIMRPEGVPPTGLR